MNLFIASLRKRLCSLVGLLIGAMQMFLAARAWAQTVSLPEPLQVRGKNQVVALTQHAVHQDGRDAFALNRATSAALLRISPGDTLKDHLRQSSRQVPGELRGESLHGYDELAFPRTNGLPERALKMSARDVSQVR